ncbi:lipid-A-disaccharide synthase [Acidobacteriota bacterium]
MGPILVVAGENSGDKHGAGLIHQFKKKNPTASFFGIGGEMMKAEGVELIYSVKDLSVMGAFELISHLSRLKKIFTHIKNEAKKRNPSAAILIDSPDFNLRLAKVLKKQSTPVLYYISPTVWAWRKGRLKTIQRYVNQMMLIFPFEEALYKENSVEAIYVGHPLLERMEIALSKEDFCNKLNINKDEPIVCLMPGSRNSEIKYHMPILTAAIEKLAQEMRATYVLLLAESVDQGLINQHIKSCQERIHVLKEDRYECMAYSDLILSSCGTANLEAALVETPFISFYRISPWTYNLGLPFIKTRTYSIVNILAGKKIVPELIQKQFTPEKLFRDALKILSSDQIRTEMIDQFKKIKDILGTKRASENASAELEKLIGVRL